MSNLGRGIANMLTHVTGTALLSMEFGWKVGLGIGLLVYFHKGQE